MSACKNLGLNKKLTPDYWVEKVIADKGMGKTKEQTKAINQEIFFIGQEEGYLYDLEGMMDMWGYGIVVKRTTIKAKPISALVCEENNEQEENNLTAILVNVPIVIVKCSADKKWYYIYTYYYCGWIEAENAALFKERSEWCRAIKIKNPLVITGSRVRLECDSYREKLSNLELSMGTVLELESDIGLMTAIAGRNVCCNYVVKIPVRQEDGYVSFEAAELPVSADVSVGYISQKPENIIRQAFKTLGERYGWGGSYNSRDCASLVCDIFSCFGILLPRDTKGMQQLCRASFYESVKDMTPAQKEQYLCDVKPGSILGFPGHVMLYLGNEAKDHYVISQTGHFCLMEGKVLRVFQVNSCVVNDLSVLRKNGVSWLASLTYILHL